jgi:hypothetical protein
MWVSGDFRPMLHSTSCGTSLGGHNSFWDQYHKKKRQKVVGPSGCRHHGHVQVTLMAKRGSMITNNSSARLHMGHWCTLYVIGPLSDFLLRVHDSFSGGSARAIVTVAAVSDPAVLPPAKRDLLQKVRPVLLRGGLRQRVRRIPAVTNGGGSAILQRTREVWCLVGAKFAVGSSFTLFIGAIYCFWRPEFRLTQ